jgi:hypothetical protein
MRDERSTGPGWDALRFRVVRGTAWLGCCEPNMRSVNDVEAYLGKMSRQFSPVEDQPGTFLVHGGTNMPPTALRVDPPLVVLRVHVGDVEGSDDANGPLFKKLLTLNAKSLVHASFGLEDTTIVLVSALELENLDYNELEAALDEIDVTLAQQVPTLAELSKAASVRPGTEGKGKA